MPSFMTIVVLALAASNVSTALAVPIQEVREQSLSRRNNPYPPPGYPPPGYPPPGYPNGYPPPGYLNGYPPPGPDGLPEQENSVRPGKPPTEPINAEPPKKAVGGPNVYRITFLVNTAPPKKAVPVGGSGKARVLNFIMGAAAAMTGISILNRITRGGSSRAPASAPSSTSSTSTPQTSQTQYGYRNTGTRINSGNAL